MTLNISISTLTNKTLNDNSISIRNILNTNYVNTNSLFDNTYKTEKINSHSKLLMDNIINNNAQINNLILFFICIVSIIKLFYGCKYM